MAEIIKEYEDDKSITAAEQIAKFSSITKEKAAEKSELITVHDN
jgi:hypothetical protein